MLAPWLALSGCTDAAEEASEAGSEELAAAMFAAVDAEDPRAWQELLADDATVAVSDRLFDNLTALQVAAITATGRERPGEAGGQVTETEFGVDWSVDGWDGRRQTPVWLTVAGTGVDARLVAASPSDQSYRLPLWLSQAVRVAVDQQTAVLAATDPEQWLAATTRLPEGTPEVLILVPRNSDEFAAYTDRRGVAAVTLDSVDGPQIVVNPGETAQLSALGRAVLITHEAVHVATDSANTEAPLWVEEGYAEFVAQRQWPQAREEMDRALAASLRAQQEPDQLSGLPADSAFSGDSAAVAYGRALLAWRIIGADNAAAVYRSIADGDPVDQALAPVGLSVRELAERVDSAADDLIGS